MPVDMSWMIGSWPGRGTPIAIGLTDSRRSVPPNGATWMPKPAASGTVSRIVPFLAQDDWVRWGSATQTDGSDAAGHEFRASYMVTPRLNLVARLFVVEAITSVQDDFRRIIVITHIDELKARLRAFRSE